MNAQPSLQLMLALEQTERVPAYPEAPGFRTRGTPTTPSPDMLAAEKIARRVPRLLLLCCKLLAHAGKPLTPDQAAKALSLLISQQTARARFSQAHELGLVARAGHGLSADGNPQWRYQITPKGREWVARMEAHNDHA